jgi:hypothetical protein
VFVLRPEPLTGDAEADAACNAIAAVLIEDGKGSGAKPATLTADERNAVIREVMEHSAESSIEEIRQAGIALGATNVMSGMPLLGSVCAEHGWDPQAAGLLD